MKNALIIVTVSLLAAACAPAVPQETAQPRTIVLHAVANQVADINSLSEDAAKTTSAKEEDAPPLVELTEDLLFKILSAEFAFQRGQWQTAYINLLSAAQQTRDPRLARRAAEIAVASKQNREALAAIRLWRTLTPKSEEASQYFLGLIISSDDLSEAQPIFEKRLKEVRPQSRNLLMFQIQRLLARAKDKAAGFAMLEKILSPYLSSAETHLVLAQGAFAAGDATRARAEANLALNAKPDSELAVLTLAQVTSDKAVTTKALTDFLVTHPNARDVRTAYARILLEQKQYAKARAEFEILHVAQPQDLTTLYALGVLGMQTNDTKSAEKYFTNYINTLSAHPDDTRDPSQVLLILAQFAEERKDFDAALKWLAKIEPGTSYLSAQINHALIVAKRGDIAAARKLLASLTPENERGQIQVILTESQLLRNAKLQQDAFAVLETGLKRFPNNTDLLYDYAMLAEKAENLSLMETSLRKIIALAPDNKHAYNALGYSLAERNIRLPEALVLIEKALKLAPEDPFIMDSLGWVQFRMGNLKEAEALLRRAYLLRSDPEIAVHLGEVLWVKGQKEDAQKLWRDAQNKDPQNDTLKSTLARLQVHL